MSDLNEWLKERRTIHDAATKGPWEAHGTTAATAWSGAGDYSGPIDDREPVANAPPGDVSAIVDAHNTLPSLLTAVEKVLELHKPEEYEDPAGTFFCRACGDWNMCEDPLDEQPDWPCPTVRAIEGAIEGAIK